MTGYLSFCTEKNLTRLAPGHALFKIFSANISGSELFFCAKLSINYDFNHSVALKPCISAHTTLGKHSNLGFAFAKTQKHLRYKMKLKNS